MSNKVDNQVVQMTFDNKKFEANAKDTMNTLDKLKKKLKFDDTCEELEQLQKASDNVNFKSIETNLQRLADFTTIPGRAFAKLFDDIAHKAVQVGEDVFKALSITPVMDGFREYENKIQSIQTIAANTGVLMRNLEQDTKATDVWGTYNWTEEEINDAKAVIRGSWGNGQDRIDQMAMYPSMDYVRIQAKVNDLLYNFSNEGENSALTIEDIEDALDELNTYADDTIYNFAQMTQAIGTFTTAGVDFHDSVTDVKGIANLAAFVGAPASDASRAMFQLSQALSTGRVRLQDWMSIEHTAGMGGKIFQESLKETARVHGIAVDEMIESEGSFRESLKHDWLTNDVLNETLAKFSGDFDKEYWLQLGYTEQQADEIERLGAVAQDAATKIRTWTQFKESTLEAVGSSWAKSWELIIGDFYEAPKLLTNFANAVSSVIDRVGEFRNRILQIWHDLGGKENTIQAFKNLAEAIGNIFMYIGAAFDFAFETRPTIIGMKINELAKGFLKFTEGLKKLTEKLSWLTYVFGTVFSIAKIFLVLIGDGIKLIFKFTEVLFSGFGGIGPVFENVFGWIYSCVEGLREFVETGTLFEKATGVITKAAKGLKKIFELLGMVLGWVALKIVDVFSALSGLSFKEALQAIAMFFGGVIMIAIDFVKDLSLKEAVDALTSLPGKIAKTFKEKAKGAKDAVKGFFSKDKDSPNEQLQETVKSTEKETSLLSKLLDGVKVVWEKIKKVVKEGNLFYAIMGAITSISAIDMMHSIRNFFDSIELPELKGIFENTAKLIGNTAKTMKALGGVLKAYSMDIKAGALIKIAMAVGILTIAIWGLTKLPVDAIKNAVKFISILLGEIFLISNFSGEVAKIVALSAALLALSMAINLILVPILVFAFLPLNRVEKGIMIFAAVMFIFALFVKMIAGLKTNLRTGKMLTQMALAVLGIAAAVNMLLIPITVFSFIPADKLEKGLNTVLKIFLILGIFIIVIEKQLDKIKNVRPSNIIAMGGLLAIIFTMIIVMVPTILIFGFLKDKVTTGIFILGAIIVAMGFIIWEAGKAANAVKGSYKRLYSFGATIAALVLGLMTATTSILIFSFIDGKKLAKGIATFAGVMAVMLGTIAVIALIEKKIGTGAGPGLKLAGTLVAIATGLMALAGVVMLFAYMQPARLWSATAALLGIVMGLTLLMVALGYMYRYKARYATAMSGAHTPFDWKKWAMLAVVIAVAAAGFWVLSVAMFKLADAAVRLSDAKWQATVAIFSMVIVVIAGMTVAIIVLLKEFDKIKVKKLKMISITLGAFAGMFLSIAAAILLVAVAMKIMANNVSGGGIAIIAITLVTLLGSLIAIVAIIAHSGPDVATKLKNLALVLASFAAITVGIGMLVLGIALLIDALIRLSTADTSGLKYKLTDVLQAISYNMELISQIIHEFFELIGDLIGVWLTRKIHFFCTIIASSAGPILEAVIDILKQLKEHGEEIGDLFMKVINAILEGICNDDNVEMLVSLLIVFLIKVLVGLTEALKANARTIADVLVDLVAVVIEIIYDILVDAIDKLCTWFGNLIGGKFGKTLKNVGKIIRGNFNSSEMDMDSFYGDDIRKYYHELYGGTAGEWDFDNHNYTEEEYENFRQARKAWEKQKAEYQEAQKDLEESAANSGSFKVTNPYADKDYKGSASKTVSDITKELNLTKSGAFGKISDFTTSIKNKFDSEKFNMFNVKGIGQRIKDGLGEELGIAGDGLSFDAIKEKLGIGNSFDMGQLGAQFGDISQISQGIGFNTSEMGIDANNVDMSGSLSNSTLTSRNLTTNLGGDDKSTTKITDSISSLGNKLSELIEPMKRLTVVLDTGTLVGSLADPLDEELGKRAAARSRGV